jgi:hypothetical protein
MIAVITVRDVMSVMAVMKSVVGFSFGVTGTEDKHN